MSSSRRRRLDMLLFAGALGTALILFNVVSERWFGRLDLTRDQQFSLSKATTATLQTLERPVHLRAYFSGDLPAPYSSNARYVRDMLETYFTLGQGQIAFQVVDPGTATDPGTGERDIFGAPATEAPGTEGELRRLGIPPVQMRINKGDKLEVKRAYMGISIQSGERREVIPVVQNTLGLEYQLTTAIRKVSRQKTLRLGLVDGHGGPTRDAGLRRALGVLEQLYDVVSVDLASTQWSTLEALSALWVVGPKTALSKAEKATLNRYLAQGGSVAMLLDSHSIDLKNLEHEKHHHGLKSWLKNRGLRMRQGFIVDRQCATINVAEQHGFMRVAQAVPYPLIPRVDGSPDHPVSRALPALPMPFAQPLYVDLSNPRVSAYVLLQSSENSWVQDTPPNVDPRQRWTLDDPPEGALPIVVALEGPIGTQANRASTAPDARLVVASTSQFINDAFMSAHHDAFLLNLTDWLVRDDALLAVRSRGLRPAPLTVDDPQIRNTLKHGNIWGLPIAFAGFGLWRWRRREEKRRHIHL